MSFTRRCSRLLSQNEEILNDFKGLFIKAENFKSVCSLKFSDT